MEISNRTLRLLLAMIFLGLISTTSASDFYVGGKDGWVRNPSESFDHWAGRLRFQVHDKLVFKYAKGEDSVLEVSKEGYDSCNVSASIKKVDSTFEFDRSGYFYFISGANGSCASGQKLQVAVMADRNKPVPTPSSSPSPPSQSPSVSPSSSPSSLSPSSSAPSPSSVSPSSSAPSSSSVSPAVSPSSSAPSPSSVSPSLSPMSSPMPYSVSPSLSPSPSSISPSSDSPSPSPSSGSSPPSPAVSTPPAPSPNATPPSPAASTSPAPSPSENNQSSAFTISSFSVGLLVLLLACTASVIN